jgi:hypothetical protein
MVVIIWQQAAPSEALHALKFACSGRPPLEITSSLRVIFYMEGGTGT